MSKYITQTDFYTKRQRCTILQSSGNVLTSPTAYYNPPRPKEDLTIPEDEGLEPSDAFHLRWDLTMYPQCAFAPLSLNYSDALLARLKIYRVVEYPSGKFGLDAECMKSWQWLELTLTHAIGALSSGIIVPLPTRFFPYPERFGYTRTHKKKGHAIKCAKTSKQAFTVLLGLFSMFFSITQEANYRYRLFPERGSGCKENARDVILKYTSLSDLTIQSLYDMHAILGPRVGVVVNVSSNMWLCLFQTALVYAGAPVWYYWGSNPNKLSGTATPLYNQYRPEPDVLKKCVQHLLKNSLPSVCSTDLDRPNIAPPVYQPPPPADAPETSSSTIQLDKPLHFLPIKPLTNETCKVFIERKKKYGISLRAKATPVQLQSWDSRERHSRENAFPASTCKVFCWVEGMEAPGGRQRVPMQKKEWDKVWYLTDGGKARSLGQRFYDPIFNEWDVCTELDPDEQDRPQQLLDVAEHMGDVEEMTDFDDYPVFRPPAPAPYLNTTVPPPARAIPPDHDHVGQQIVYGEGTEVVQKELPHLDDILYERFGFYISDIASALGDGRLSFISHPCNFDYASAVLMEKQAVAQQSLKQAVIHVVSSVLARSSIPMEFWDLSPKCPDHITRHSHPWFRFTYFETKNLYSSDKLSGYIVEPRDPKYKRPWTLMIESATAVMQSIRQQWGPSLENLILETTRLGFRIHVFAHVLNGKHLQPPVPPPVLYSPRVRSEGFEPTVYDFYAYQNTRDTLLLQPRFKATVFRGGILHRLCASYFDEYELVGGPSSDVLRYGQQWKGPNGSVLVEDCITDAEIDLLCGLFLIETGRPSPNARETQVARKSFYPLPDVWDKSGLNTGVWCHSAEAKIQSLEEQLKTGPRVHSRADWTKVLRLYKQKTKDFIGYVESEAHRTLTA